MLNLEEVFEKLLPEPTREGSLMLASPIPGFEKHRVARESGNTPTIMISVKHSDALPHHAPIKLENLTVKYDVNCRFTGSDGMVEEGLFTLISCSGADPVLNAYFLRVMGTVIQILGPTPIRSDVSRTIRNLVELFRLMHRAPRRSVQGLWAELFVINRAHNAAVLIEAWHTTPEDRYDFNNGSQRVEVKSAAGRVRRHTFSLEQLKPPDGTAVLIASLFVERAGAGTSLGELVEAIRKRVANNPDLVMAIDLAVSLALGNALRQAMLERFDYELAQHTLAFYELAAVPSIKDDLPPEVTAVHFTSDISSAPTANMAQRRQEGGLFAAVL